jgi:hypothetical protein
MPAATATVAAGIRAELEARVAGARPAGGAQLRRRAPPVVHPNRGQREQAGSSVEGVTEPGATRLVPVAPPAASSATVEASMVLPGPGDYTLRWAGPDGQQHAVSVTVTGATPATSAPPAQPPALPRGVRTTEFWVTAATAATPLLALAGRQEQVAAFAAAASAVTGVVYTVSRHRTKLAAMLARLEAGEQVTTTDVVTVADSTGDVVTALRQETTGPAS